MRLSPVLLALAALGCRSEDKDPIDTVLDTAPSPLMKTATASPVTRTATTTTPR
jgi:hypothetical protein